MEKICSHCGKSFMAVREVKKYCSDSCKQLAFYKRSSDFADDVNDNQEHLISLTKLDKAEIIDKVNTNEEIENINEPITNLINQDKRKYEPVMSIFIEELFNKTETTEIYAKSQQSKKHWTNYEFENIKWVSARLRCLIENILRLSNEPVTKKSEFKELKDCFMSIMEATQFKQLPNDYPYKKLINSLQNYCEDTVNGLAKKGSSKLMLQRNRKIELLSVRFILSVIVPKISCADLWFNEIVEPATARRGRLRQ